MTREKSEELIETLKNIKWLRKKQKCTNNNNNGDDDVITKNVSKIFYLFLPKKFFFLFEILHEFLNETRCQQKIRLN